MNRIKERYWNRSNAQRRIKLVLFVVLIYIIFSLFWYHDKTGINSSYLKSLLKLNPLTHLSFHTNESNYDTRLTYKSLDDHNPVESDPNNHQHSNIISNVTTVAIGLGITSKSVNSTNINEISRNFQFMFTFLPSFCGSASDGYSYSFYLAYDYNDSAFINETFQSAFSSHFHSFVSSNCSKNISTSIHFVRCDHTAKPAWAQNDAMMEAYLDNNDYYYRINDDTNLLTKNWTSIFIEHLNKFNPKNVGVVGPNHYGGNVAILTYDFVHKTHIDILGYYYPRSITDWWGDDWMSEIYLPGRMKKIRHVRLLHTAGAGRRYNVNYNVRTGLRSYILASQSVIRRHLEYRNMLHTNHSRSSSRRIISMSLFGRDKQYTWGAIRNAQTASVYLPGWTLRFYVPGQGTSGTDLTVPPRVISKLKQLGAELVPVPPDSVPPRFWRYLVLDDQDVELFLIRDSNYRISDRESYMINDWINKTSQSSTTKSLYHCIRDYKIHANRSVIEGLWGGDAREIRKTLASRSIVSTVKSYLETRGGDSSNTSTAGFLETELWPQLQTSVYCHDTVTCGSHVALNIKRNGYEYVGEKFDEHQMPVNRERWLQITNGSIVELCQSTS